MPTTPANAVLQRRILLSLLGGPSPSGAALARVVDAKRPSVSRALRALEVGGFVHRAGRTWSLTDAGMAEAAQMREQAPRRTGTTLAALERGLQEQIKVLRSLETSFPGQRFMQDIQDMLSPAARMRDQLDHIQKMLADSLAPSAILLQSVGKMSALPAGLDQWRTFGTMGPLLDQPASRALAEAIGSLAAMPPLALEQFRLPPALDLGEAMRAAFAPPMPAFDTGLTDQIRRTLAEITCGFQAQWSALPRFNIQDLFPSIDWPWLGEWQQERRVREAFTAASFVPSPSMDEALIESVVQSHEDGAERDELTALILTAYDADDCRLLASLVDRLCANSRLAPWCEVLRQTLSAHRQRLDAITAQSLVPMIEGLLVPLLNDVFEVKKTRHVEIAARLLEMPADVAGAIGFAGYECMVEYFETSLYLSYDWTLDPDAHTTEGLLNRHDLLHGRRQGGTREHALRCFLMLDVIETLLRVIHNMEDDHEVEGMLA